MKRKLFAFVLIVVLCAALAMPAYAQKDLLVDEAGLLSAADASEVRSALEAASKRQGVEISVVIVRTMGGNDPDNFADSYYGAHGYAADGVMLMINMGERDWVIIADGFGKKAVNEDAREYISDTIVPYLSEGEYALAFRMYAQMAEQIIADAREGNFYKTPFHFGGALMWSVLIAVVAAFVVVNGMKGQLKSVAMQYAAADYEEEGSLMLTQSGDRFLYRSVTRTPKSDSGSTNHDSGRSSSSGKF